MVDFYYKKYGKGVNNLIFFHGFGEDHAVFETMISSILSENINVTCYAIDIYYHGKSKRNDMPLQPDEWGKVFLQFLEKENIQSFGLVGFSLGGRFVLSTLTSIPKAISAIILIAPDGVFQSTWYKLSNTHLGNRLFKYLMNNPNTFDLFINFFKSAGLVSKPISKFVERALRSSNQRKRVYQTWTYFYPLQLKTQTIANYLARYDIPIHVILGEQDKIIPPHKIISMFKPIRNIQMVVISAKHHQMINQSTSRIISILKNQNS